MNMGHILLACIIAWVVAIWMVFVYMPCSNRYYSMSQTLECAYDSHVDIVRDAFFD